MGIMVYMPLSSLVVTATQQDIFSVRAASGSKIKIHGFELTSNATVGEIAALNFRRVTVSGVGGSAGTPEPADESLGPSTAITRRLDTTIGTDGGSLKSFQWEQLGPVGLVYTPEMRPTSQPGQGFALTMRAPFASATISGWACWEEL